MRTAAVYRCTRKNDNRTAESERRSVCAQSLLRMTGSTRNASYANEPLGPQCGRHVRQEGRREPTEAIQECEDRPARTASRVDHGSRGAVISLLIAVRRHQIVSALSNNSPVILERVKSFTESRHSKKWPSHM